MTDDDAVMMTLILGWSVYFAYMAYFTNSPTWAIVGGDLLILSLIAVLDAVWRFLDGGDSKTFAFVAGSLNEHTLTRGKHG